LERHVRVIGDCTLLEVEEAGGGSRRISRAVEVEDVARLAQGVPGCKAHLSRSVGWERADGGGGERVPAAVAAMPRRRRARSSEGAGASGRAALWRRYGCVLLPPRPTSSLRSCGGRTCSAGERWPASTATSPNSSDSSGSRGRSGWGGPNGGSTRGQAGPVPLTRVALLCYSAGFGGARLIADDDRGPAAGDFYYSSIGIRVPVRTA